MLEKFIARLMAKGVDPKMIEEILNEMIMDGMKPEMVADQISLMIKRVEEANAPTEPAPPKEEVSKEETETVKEPETIHATKHKSTAPRAHKGKKGDSDEE